MKIFHCDHCDHLAFFENTQCVTCGHLLAFLPELAEIGSLEQQPDGGWVSPLAAARGRSYRLCRNYAVEQVCNWVVDAADPGELCASCRLTRLIPDLTVAGNREAWYRLEAAKRRVIYTLLNLRLPFAPDQQDQHGLVFEFLADPQNGTPPVLTGHAGGVVTINVAEADDAERERRRRELGEPYRTLLGHVRHEVGHYYWTRLIERGGRLEQFRTLFGDERADYGEALQRHYARGPAPEWSAAYVSAYASAHPWEDWAETWAHYLHMTDTLETAAACGVSLRPRRAGEPALQAVPADAGTPSGAFDRLIDSWYPLTYMLNNLNRGMGQPDAYPFVLSPAAVEKLRFIHETVAA